MSGSPTMRDLRGMLRRVGSVLSLVWAAGCVGGVANWLIGPLFQSLHILDYSHVDLHYSLDRSSLYAHLAWGGLWGLVFLFTLPRDNPLSTGHWQFWARAFLYGLVPALVQIFIILPHDGHGIGGEGLGGLTWFYVVVFCTLGWSIPAYAWLFIIGPNDTTEGYGYDALAGSVV